MSAFYSFYFLVTSPSHGYFSHSYYMRFTMRNINYSKIYFICKFPRISLGSCRRYRTTMCWNDYQARYQLWIWVLNIYVWIWMLSIHTYSISYDHHCKYNNSHTVQYQSHVACVTYLSCCSDFLLKLRKIGEVYFFSVYSKYITDIYLWYFIRLIDIIVYNNWFMTFTGHVHICCYSV